MVFSSIVFLCIFLPLVVLLYYLLPQKLRNFGLFVVSLLFYAWGEPRYILIMLFSTIFDYTNGRLIERFQDKKSFKKAVLVTSVVVNLGLLGYFKYTDFMLENLNDLFGTQFGLLQLALPIGISFYTFQTLSYTIDVYYGKATVQHNIIDFGMYICLFPQLIAGPIVRYVDLETQISDRAWHGEYLWQGLCRFFIGLAKKVLLANQIGSLWEEILGYQGVVPAGTAWLGAIAFTFQIYFDFSGYSDMAIGLGQMFGFTFPENFRYPYEAKSITDFWRRWHITLGSWFREYVYIPLGGNRCSKGRIVLNLLIVWSLTGIWHGAGWNFVFWGFFYFALIGLEKMFLAKQLEQLPSVFQHLYALLFIVLGWVIFACEDMKVLGSYLTSLFGGHGGMDSMTLYYLQSYGLLFLIAAISATSLPKRSIQNIAKRLRVKGGQVVLIQFLYVISIAAVSLTLLVGDSYNPFLYFRF